MTQPTVSGHSQAGPLNIVFLIDGLRGGGAEKVVLTLAGEMARLQHRVTVISLDRVQDYVLPDGVSLLVVGDDYRGPLRRLTEVWRRARQLERALDVYFGECKIDLAISNLLRCDRIVAACPRLGDAWFCLHNALIAGQLAHRHGLHRWLKCRRLRALYHRRKLITVSAGLQKDLANCGIRPAELLTIHNPFDLAQIRTLAAAPCPLDGQPFVLHVGRLHRQKRHDRLLQAVKLSGYSGKIVLLGQGTPAMDRAIREQAAALGIADRLVMPGFCDNPYAWMRAADALILSSDYEGFGNVLVEALACGTPVVSTRSPHGPDEILTGELAIGLSEMDPLSLAAALNRTLDAPPRIDPSRIEAYAVQHIAARYIELVAGNAGSGAAYPTRTRLSAA